LLFGDLLALARRSWVDQMASRLALAGHGNYRRSDAAVMRLLSRGPVPVGRLGSVLGVTRQASRKLAEALSQRGYAVIERDVDDSRKLNVVLTPAGEAYAKAVVAVIGALNRELEGRLHPDQLAAAETALRTVIADGTPA
jgi:DNA-binding MarR family transcriptional regulator